MTIDPRTPTMPGGARRVFTDQAGIVCTKREAPWVVRQVAWRVSCTLQTTASEADVLAFG